jgi:glycosyltransferase involved in cell wall biosynthesis
LNISIIIPVYNEAQGIEAFIRELLATAVQIQTRWSAKIEFVFIDDGSRDGSADVIRKLDFGAFSSRLFVMSRNFGKEAALTAAMHKVENCDAAIMIDADLEHPPKLMEKLIETWQTSDADSVYYYKSDRRSREGLVKSSVSKMFYRLMNFGTNVEIIPDAGDYRLINAKFLDALKNLAENQRFMKGLYSWVGFEQVGLPFAPGERTAGTSNFSAIKLILLALDGLTSFTTAPLRLMMLGGLAISAISILYGLYIVVEALFFPGVPPGIASILTLISLFGGLQLLCLGILGEYVGRALHEAKGRPAYIIREEIEIVTRKPSRSTRSRAKAKPKSTK